MKQECAQLELNQMDSLDESQNQLGQPDVFEACPGCGMMSFPSFSQNQD